MSNEIWDNLKSLILNILHIRIVFTDSFIVTGSPYLDQNLSTFNIVIFATKYYLPVCYSKMESPISYFTKINKKLYKNKKFFKNLINL